jgi:hypothetical protein
VKSFIWSIALCSAETGTLGNADKKSLESLKMCSRGWRRSFGPIVCKKKKYESETREERNDIRAIKRRKADWIGYILRRNCLVIHASKKTYNGGEDEEEDV